MTSTFHFNQAECSTMISLLKDLEKEEHDLQCQIEILAKEALLCGFQNDIFEPPIPKRRTKKQPPPTAASTKEEDNDKKQTQ